MRMVRKEMGTHLCKEAFSILLMQLTLEIAEKFLVCLVHHSVFKASALYSKNADFISGCLFLFGLALMQLEDHRK